MANELAISCSASFSKGGAVDPERSFSKQVDIAGDGFMSQVVSIGTADEVVSFGDVTPGFVMLKNLDSTNYVEYGRASGSYLARAKAGEPGMFRLNTGESLHMKANTAAVLVELRAYPN